MVFLGIGFNDRPRGFGLVLTLRGQCQRIGAEVALWLRQLGHFWWRPFGAGRGCDRPLFRRSHPERIAPLQSSFHKRVNRWSRRGDSVGGQKLDDGLPRLAFAPRFEDQVEVRLQFALKRFAGHTPMGDVNRFYKFPGVSRSGSVHQLRR